MAWVEAIRIKRAKGQPPTYVRKVRLIADHGLEGDCKAGPGDMQVCLLPAEARERMPVANGLCTARFSENIVTRGLATQGLPVGTRLHIGEAILELTVVGKHCHGCDLQGCPLAEEATFARVVGGGEVRVGDGFSMDFSYFFEKK